MQHVDSHTRQSDIYVIYRLNEQTFFLQTQNLKHFGFTGVGKIPYCGMVDFGLDIYSLINQHKTLCSWCGQYLGTYIGRDTVGDRKLKGGHTWWEPSPNKINIDFYCPKYFFLQHNILTWNLKVLLSIAFKCIKVS